MKNKTLVAAVMAMTLMCAGCAHNANAPAPTPIQKAAIVLDDFAASAQAAQQAEIGVYQQALTDKATHARIEKAFVVVAEDQAAVSRLLTAGASQADVSAAVAALTAEINGDLTNGVLGVKDPASQARLKALVTAMGSSAELIVTAYGGN